jgi:iron(III) transport system substrate-binding protein
VTGREGGALAAILAASILALPAPTPAAAEEVNVYTYREPDLIKPLFDKFTAETAIKVNAVFATDGLEERVEMEGDNSPADLLVTVDVARLQKAVDLGIAQPFRSKVMEEAVPANLRDPGGAWYGLSERARVVYASKERVADAAITYEDLADPKWKGRICIRSGQHHYNLALFGAMIAKHGAEEAKTWLEGLKANLARRPSGADRDVAKDIAAGICDIGVGNTYYVGLMEHDPVQKAWTDQIKVIMPTFRDGGGTHVNISGVVLARNAPNRANAVRLAEWLVSDEAQKIYADTNFEYPVKPGIAISPDVLAFGPLKRDALPLPEIARTRAAASEMVDAVGFDQ